ncbi:MAG: DUF4386 domain-containing protein [Candidatus Dormibacteraeota bacterium]|nr:DUF4386 domain-containing protein [Candidatus Dormibacteraeota bacterium]
MSAVIDVQTVSRNRSQTGAAPVKTTSSPKRIARIAGGLYLFLGIFGGFAQGYVYPKLFGAGNATNTVRDLIANSDLVRVGVVSDLFQATVWVLLAITLYGLLRHVSTTAASVMVVFAALGAGITMLNSVFEYEALRVATGALNLGASSSSGSSGLALLLVDAQHNGLLIASIFMGLWLVPLGYLAYKSGWFPKVLGVVLIVGGACYIVDLAAAFLIPDLGKAIHGYVTIPSIIAEISLLVYLLAIGVRSPKTAELSSEPTQG